MSAVVLKGLSLQTLSEAQATALRQWIAGGGTLIVASDSRYALLTEPRLQALLPVRVFGVRQRDGLPELAARYGVPLPAAPLLAIQARLARGEVLAGTPDAPLLAQRTPSAAAGWSSWRSTTPPDPWPAGAATAPCGTTCCGPPNASTSAACSPSWD